eukprot:SAG11_NODE_4065_length_2082_cov_1.178013_4_plen_168_part_00
MTSITKMPPQNSPPTSLSCTQPSLCESLPSVTPQDSERTHLGSTCLLSCGSGGASAAAGTSGAATAAAAVLSLFFLSLFPVSSLSLSLRLCVPPTGRADVEGHVVVAGGLTTVPPSQLCVWRTLSLRSGSVHSAHVHQSSSTGCTLEAIILSRSPSAYSVSVLDSVR